MVKLSPKPVFFPYSKEDKSSRLSIRDILKFFSCSPHHSNKKYIHRHFLPVYIYIYIYIPIYIYIQPYPISILHIMCTLGYSDLDLFWGEGECWHGNGCQIYIISDIFTKDGFPLLAILATFSFKFSNHYWQPLLKKLIKFTQESNKSTTSRISNKSRKTQFLLHFLVQNFLG